jgi:MFS family permease
VLGLWGAGFWSPELIDSTLPTVDPGTKDRLRQVAKANPAAQATLIKALQPDDQRKFLELRKRTLLPGEKLEAKAALQTPLTPAQQAKLEQLLGKAMPENEKTRLKSSALVLQQVGAFFGIYVFGLAAARFGRKPSFLVALLAGWASVLLTFGTFQDRSQIWYLWPILGFGTLAVFGGYAIYFPELFPTRLRSTGTGFCYNVGRYIAAIGPLTLGQLALLLQGQFETPGFRLAAMIVASAYAIGLVALFWAPETRNQPLPEEEPA